MNQAPPFYYGQYPFAQAGGFSPWMGAAPPYAGAMAMANPSMMTQAAAPKTGLTGLLQRFIPAGGNLTDTLGQLQNVLKMTQSVTPMIQQYGPILKNLPSMMALMKAFNESDGENQEGQSEEQASSNENALNENDDQLTTNKANSNDDNATPFEEEPTKIEASQDNLYKIETLEDSQVAKQTYRGPVLYI
ncbi:YqfQ-like protein [Amphibacillus marinus]|uniref:YqfQ-like protein n=1 Tax=Amphibacillus marinus TaxID=872970 RepID=A0A1H8GMG8_9BACI|nr:VrrA/YqfQ family protein [Amphibacillus marinus]SEN45019.1 YqfQ-like protein [Amphibacillus marinus]